MNQRTEFHLEVAEKFKCSQNEWVSIVILAHQREDRMFNEAKSAKPHGGKPQERNWKYVRSSRGQAFIGWRAELQHRHGRFLNILTGERKTRRRE